jgi:hypothetical protein
LLSAYVLPFTIKPAFPISNPFLNFRIVTIINIYAGVNAMTTLRRSVSKG